MVDRGGPSLGECEHLGQRFSALLSRNGIVRVAEDADGPTTQYAEENSATSCALRRC